jgi:hypothetical protein
MAINKIHEMDTSIFALTPMVTVVLIGDWTDRISPGDEIKTNLVRYRVEALSYDAPMNKTVILVKEIVL